MGCPPQVKFQILKYSHCWLKIHVFVFRNQQKFHQRNHSQKSQRRLPLLIITFGIEIFELLLLKTGLLIFFIIIKLLFRLTDVELNKLKGDSVARTSETPAKIPILIVVRSLGTGKQEALEGLEIIAPTGFGKYFFFKSGYFLIRSWFMDCCTIENCSCFWLIRWFIRSFRVRRSSLSCRLPWYVCWHQWGCSNAKRIRGFLNNCLFTEKFQDKYLRRPHNRRVLYWKKNSIKFPFTFELSQLVSEWSGINAPKVSLILFNNYFNQIDILSSRSTSHCRYWRLGTRNC